VSPSVPGAAGSLLGAVSATDATVGTLGSAGKRVLPVVASARILPACTFGSAEGMLSTI